MDKKTLIQYESQQKRKQLVDIVTKCQHQNKVFKPEMIKMENKHNLERLKTDKIFLIQ